MTIADALARIYAAGVVLRVDGTKRTLAGEFAKLACSVMILGDLLGAYE